jgi:hypothetical protein
LKPVHLRSLSNTGLLLPNTPNRIADAAALPAP